MSEQSTFPQQTEESASSKENDLLPEDNIFDSSFVDETKQYAPYKHVDRPMSAKPRRPIRTFEGCIIDKTVMPQANKDWSPYFAGDEVYRICGIGATTSYPRPSPMSTTGILEVSSLADTLRSTPMRYL